jgi:hypothetical protein
MRATTTNIDIVRDRYRYVGAGWQSWATDKRSLIASSSGEFNPLFRAKFHYRSQLSCAVEGVLMFAHNGSNLELSYFSTAVGNQADTGN